MRKILQGNEAIARGAWEAGVTVGCAYPGTPSSEILAELSKYPEVYTEWSPNEKVAVEVAHGASFAGGRAIACMKHVGLNVAADPFMTISYTGVKGGFVIVVADDPGQHSSQNEQDSRHWTRFGKVPMLEPADAQECSDFTRIAFDMSERFDTPVLLRSETRVSHCDSAVELGERKESTIPKGLDKKDTPKMVMVPMYARVRRILVEERIGKLATYADEEFPYNVMEINDPSIGFIASGVTYLHTKEVFPQYSFLKLGMTWPLPKKLIAEFFKKVKKVIVVEELDPFFETEIRAMGFKVRHGKDLIPAIGELTPTIIEQSLSKAVTGKRIKPAKASAQSGGIAQEAAESVCRVFASAAVCCVEKARPFRLRRYRLLCAGGLSASVRHARLDLHGRRQWAALTAQARCSAARDSERSAPCWEIRLFCTAASVP